MRVLSTRSTLPAARTRFGPDRVSYMKPVGQKHVLVEGAGGECLKVHTTPARGLHVV